MMHIGIHITASLSEERATQRGVAARRLLEYLRPYWRQLLAVLAFVLLGAATQAAGPFLIGQAIDMGVGQKDGALLNQLMLLLLVVYIAGMFAMRSQIIAMSVVGQQLLARLRSDIFATIQRLSLRFFDRHPAGDLMSRL